MKYCLQSRQIPEVLKQADEIRVQQKDYKQIYDLTEQYPNTTIILNCPNFEEESFIKAISEFKILTQENIILCLFSCEQISQALKFKIPYYFAFPAQTLEQVRALKNLGACYVLLDNLVIHQLHELKKIQIKTRAIPNIAHLDNIERANGINGNWIRPEDIDEYSLYIDTLEFGTQPLKREQTLLRLYKEDKNFPGDLGKIVQDLNVEGKNRLLNSEHTLRRMNCNLACANTAGCSLCYDILKIATHEDVLLDL